MPADSPASILYDTTGTKFAIIDGDTIPTGTAGIFAMGEQIDAPTIARRLALSANGETVIVNPAQGYNGQLSDGRVSLAAAAAAVVNFTTYTEQGAAAQRSVVSASASDTAAGTGARTVRLTYYDNTLAGPFAETLTLNGVTPVNTVATNIRFVEKLEVLTAGSGGVNAGVINLKAGAGGAGATITSISTTTPNFNRTFNCLHYVPVGKTCKISIVTASCQGSSTSAGIFYLRAQNPLVADAANAQITDAFNVSGDVGTGAFTRSYPNPISVVGPSRIQGWAFPWGGSARSYFLAFDFYEV